jgi:hypothetical protein
VIQVSGPTGVVLLAAAMAGVAAASVVGVREVWP